MTSRDPRARLPKRFVLEVEGCVLFDTGWTTQLDIEQLLTREVDDSGRKYGLPASVSGEIFKVRLRARGGAQMSGEVDQITRAFYERQAAKKRLMQWTGIGAQDREFEAEQKLLAERKQRLQQEANLRDEVAALKAALKAELEKKEAERIAAQQNPPQWPPPRHLELS